MLNARLGHTSPAAAHPVARSRPSASDGHDAPLSERLHERFHEIRTTTLALVEPLSPEDCQVQSMPDASPAKWHLAHTTWFFETFVLRPHLPGYEEADPAYGYLFNSYYNLIGERIARNERGLMTRPSLDAIRNYRAHVDEAMHRLLHRPLPPEILEAIAPLLQIGLQHEQQHQELLLTDLKHLLSLNPLHPAYVPPSDGASRERRTERAGTPDAADLLGKSNVQRPTDHEAEFDELPLTWVVFEGGINAFGVEPDAMNDPHHVRFAFDNEGPRHDRLLQPFALASRPVTCGEYLGFVNDEGYTRPEFWLAEGWAVVQEQQWRHPLYWTKDAASGRWMQFTLHGGLRPVRPDEPVAHLSLFEADAFARWAGARLPDEFEWEHAARAAPVEGVLLETMSLHPRAITRREADIATRRRTCIRLFGDVWEWTRSQYSPYPGYNPAPGAIGEYNGKFMCNQFVLRGGSVATPASHIRATYRNFFPPAARWQFAGLRLARDV